jgi:Transglycosylase SLT domain
VFVTKCRIVTLASFIVLGMWTIAASGQPNEANVPRPCSAFPKFCELITQEAERTGLDPPLVDAVIKVESDYRPDVIGAAGEIGLMQVRPSTARLLGFGGTDRELAEPATNVRLGVTYLAKAWSLAHGDLCRALMKYRAGHGEEQMTPLSVEYCRRAREHLAQVPWVAALAAVKECKVKRLSGELKTYVQSAMCSNPGIVRAFGAVNYKRMDLIQGFAAKRSELAEKLDRGQITEAQGERELSDLSNRIRAEDRR